jgi:ribosomal protein S18 acetylase RimI-like enzyme
VDRRHRLWHTDGMTEFEVRRVSPDDAATVKRLRLRALADAPEAFASTLAAEQARPDEQWRDDVRRRAVASDEAVFLARTADGTAVGLAGCYRPPRRPEIAHVVSVWVEPAMRGRGAARLLMRAVAAWARQAGAGAMDLWVADGNLAARTLYLRLGFTETGESQPLPSDPDRLERLLRRRL